MSKDKKAFKDTKFGQFVNKAKDKLPELANVAMSVVGGNYVGAIGQVGNMLKDKHNESEDLKALHVEFESLKMDFEREMYELEFKDRDSARNREIEIAKSGNSDLMMNITGVVGLLSFLFMIYSVVFIPSVLENDLFVHLMGMIEGVVISNIFAYYYGTSSKK